MTRRRSYSLNKEGELKVIDYPDDARWMDITGEYENVAIAKAKVKRLEAFLDINDDGKINLKADGTTDGVLSAYELLKLYNRDLELNDKPRGMN